MTNYNRADHILGCLLAGAVGDALGATWEGKPAVGANQIPPELSITDDTQLTLATCEAIVAAGEVDPVAIAARFVEWFRGRRITGMGASTLQALQGLEAGAHWAIAGANGERAAGNGAAMRIAPLAFLLDPEIAAHRRSIRDVCRITHRHDEAYLGGLAVLCSIRYALENQSVDCELLDVVSAALPDCRVRDRLREVQATGMTAPQYAARYSASGYVVDSVPLAILAAVQSNDLLESIQEIALSGGDTDTIASMCGQIVGAARGTSAVPAELVDRIGEAALIRETAEAFSRVACR